MSNRLIRMTSRAGAVAALLLAVGWAGKASAQTMTPEGTVITNTATVNYKDFNGNSYTPVEASVNVTVGYKAGINVTGGETYTVTSPATDQESKFQICNTGNGTSTFVVDPLVVTNPSAISIDSYKVYAANGTTLLYTGTLAEVNTWLATNSVAAGACLYIAVQYDVLTGNGGETVTIELPAHDGRDTGTTDSGTNTSNITLSGSVAVTPDNLTETRLPSDPDGIDDGSVDPVTYTAQFTVSNNSSGSLDFNFSSGYTGPAVYFVGDPYLCSSPSTSLVDYTIAAGADALICVDYRVADVDGGTTGSVTLTATPEQNNTPYGDPVAGTDAITVIRPLLTMTKEAHLDNAGAPGDQITSETPKPGDAIWYKITVTNALSNSAPAYNVTVSDPLPAATTYVSNLPDLAGWTIGESAGTVTGTLAGTLAEGASRYFWIKVTIN